MFKIGCLGARGRVEWKGRLATSGGPSEMLGAGLAAALLAALSHY